MTLKRVTWFVFWAFVLVTVYSILALAFKLPIPFQVTPINTLLAFTFALLHAAQREGSRRTALLTGVVFATGLAFESVGVATGWVYGPYHYTDQLGPKFLDLVPYLIPIAWTMMMYPALVIAQGVIPRTWPTVWRNLAVAALGGVVMTAWDVAMDPMMVAAGHWVWDVPGAYFGVPLQNFWGWWLTTFVALWIYLVLSPRIKENPVAGFSDRWAVEAYVLLGASSILVNLLTNLQGPALAGIFAMLPWMVMGMIQHE